MSKKPKESDDRKPHDTNFRKGVAICVVKHIWDRLKIDLARLLRLERPIEHGDKNRITSFLGLPDEDFSRFDDGGMNAAKLFTAMSCMNWRGADLDELPPMEIRMIDGFRYAIFKAKGGTSSRPKEKDGRMIERHVFLVVRALLAHFLEERVNAEVLSKTEWMELHRRFAPMLPGGGEYLEQHFFEWYEVVAEVINGVSYEWE